MNAKRQRQRQRQSADVLARVHELAMNLWWSWNQGAREVFRDLDYPLWRFTDHNPVLLLHLIEHA